MCTVTFIPKPDGFLLGMNRDDLFPRADTRPPSINQTGTRFAVYPSERIGGTWIGVNDVGLVFALLNWNRPQSQKLRSRGEVIPAILRASSLDDASDLLRRTSLTGVLPFRLIGIYSQHHAVSEWRWDGEVNRFDFPWELSHWFSSGLSDQDAEIKRGTICRDALSDADARSLEWMRRLHRSHSPEPGPFSICAHRETAGTLSYTEIIAADGKVTMNYSADSPCSNTARSSITISVPH